MLTSIIHNYNTNCYKQYTNVSKYLGNLLDDSLKEIERFYYTKFWEDRFKRRLKEENIKFNYINLDIIQGLTSELRETTKFKLLNEDENLHGLSNTVIALNVNISKEKRNDNHIKNIIMHEFGHIQYNHSEFKLIIDLNKTIINNPIIVEDLSKEDVKYFTDHNEIRQRIIPIIKEMYDNNWTAEEVYELSNNLKQDDIKDIFKKEYITTLLNNLL